MIFNKKISKAFVKDLILIVVFFLLIAFSFAWFNKDNENIQKVPYINEFFSGLSQFAETLNLISVKEFDVKGILGNTVDNAKELFSSDPQNFN